LLAEEFAENPLKKAIGQGRHDPGTVTGLAVGTDRAPVGVIGQGFQGHFKYFVAGGSVDAGHEPYAATVFFTGEHARNLITLEVATQVSFIHLLKNCNANVTHSYPELYKEVRIS